MLSWYVLTSSAFKSAVEANKVTSDMMIFTSDTHEIYRGTQAYTESTVLFTGTNGAHPTSTAAVGKLYINSVTLEGWVYNGTSWTQVIKAVATTVNASDTTQAVSGKAVADYVATEVGKAQSNVTELEKTVAANKTAAEKAVSDEAAARESADNTLQGNIDTLSDTVTANKTAADTGIQEAKDAAAAAKTAADEAQADADKNAEDIAAINTTLASVATDGELEAAKTDLQNKINAVDAKADKNAEDIATLNGTAETEGSVLYMINDVLADLVGDGSQETIDSLTELVNWANEHASDVIEMNNNISANTTGVENNGKAIAALEALVGELPDGTSATTVCLYIAEVAADLAEEVTARTNGDAALAEDIGELNTAVTNLTKTVGDNKTALEQADAKLREDLTALQGTVSTLSQTVAANKTAAEQAVAAEATARGEAIAAVQEDVDANAEAIALINENLGSYATDAEVGEIRTALETLISAKMAKVGTGKTGEVIVADANGDASASGKKIGGSTFGSNQTDTLATEAGVVAYVGANVVAKTAVVTALDADAPSDAEVPSESAVVAALTWKTSI